MSRIMTGASMSLDGYIAGEGETGFDRLFAWQNEGEVSLPSANPGVSFHMTPENAGVWRSMLARTGAIVCGRRLFDLTRGWGGKHPLGVPVVVVTHTVPRDWPHPDAPFTFVTDGLEHAVARARDLAAGKDVSLTAGDLAQQALNLGLVDELWVALVPVLLGGGTRFFGDLVQAPLLLGDPEVMPGRRVTHLRYEVQRGR